MRTDFKVNIILLATLFVIKGLNSYTCDRNYTPILRIGDQVLKFDVFWPKHLQEVRSTVYIHGQSI